MDIVDIMLARALTPQGQTEIYANKANRAAEKAAQAEQSAAAAIATVEAAADEIAAAQSEATDLLADAREALQTAQQAQINTLDVEDVDAEVKKLTVNTNTVQGTTANTLQVITTYPDNTLNTQNITKLYKAGGNNEDGGMTQKAITDALANKASTAYVDNAIAAIPTGGGSGGGNTNLGPGNSGNIVVIGPDGNIISGIISEDDLIEALVTTGGYVAKDALGLEIDYDNKSFARTQQAAGLQMGTDFDSYPMYGGRRRCVVNNAGQILAFEGDRNFSSSVDGSNGQVMIYQPKFYYQRVPISTDNNVVGKTVRRDSIILSATEQSGFKIHPIFKTPEGEVLDYVLFSAYEGGLYSNAQGAVYGTTASTVDFNNDKLTSVPAAKPITGSSTLTLERAEQLAQNRGAGWHIFNMAAESANQMLEIVEFGTLNGQAALGKGICDIQVDGNKNQAALTGSTQSLGNASGSASSTTFEHDDGQTFTETTSGKVAISYRGMENPWGNTWNMLNGVFIKGTAEQNGGIPYICTNYYYSYTSPDSNYTNIGMALPNDSGWISALGYGNKDYDWVLMPSACSSSANSSLPIGDNGWFDKNLNGNRAVVCGGSWTFGDSNGPFYYGCDKLPTDTSYKSYGARLMFIPTKNAIYEANIIKANS